MTETAAVDAVTLLRDALRAALEDQNRAQRAFTSPYSGYDSTRAFYEAQGYTRGIAKAIELIEAQP